MVCPKCNKHFVESLVEKQVQLYAKHCRGDTFDYNDVKSRGVGITIGKL